MQYKFEQNSFNNTLYYIIYIYSIFYFHVNISKELLKKIETTECEDFLVIFREKNL